MKAVALLVLCLLAPLSALAANGQADAAHAANAAPAGPPAVTHDQAFLDLLFTAQEFQARGELDSARQSVVRAQEAFPRDAFAAIRLAQLDALSGELPKALAELEAVLAADPANRLAALWRGHVLYAQGRIDQAREAYAGLAPHSPSDGYAHLGLAVCLLAENQDRPAVEELAKAQALAGDDPALHHLLGRVFSGLGLWVNARLEFESALETNSRHVDTLVRVGQVYQRLNLPSLAQNAWRQALALDPKNQMALNHLLAAMGAQAATLQDDGRTQEAVTAWRLMLTYDPANTQALAHLRALRGQ